ncbi:MAG: hypothetical protein ABF868_12035 [Sporolactobacillus sp.]
MLYISDFPAGRSPDKRASTNAFPPALDPQKRAKREKERPSKSFQLFDNPEMIEEREQKPACQTIQRAAVIMTPSELFSVRPKLKNETGSRQYQ